MSPHGHSLSLLRYTEPSQSPVIRPSANLTAFLFYFYIHVKNESSVASKKYFCGLCVCLWDRERVWFCFGFGGFFLLLFLGCCYCYFYCCWVGFACFVFWLFVLILGDILHRSSWDLPTKLQGGENGSCKVS